MVNGFHNNEQALMMVSTLELNFPQHTPVVRKGKIQSLGKENFVRNCAEN
jgi:hypothetical protein